MNAKQKFFVKMDQLGLGLTFDDVILLQGHSEKRPEGVDLATKFSRNIALKIPIVSAAMDCVTEAPMAIALARAGLIGVIHRRMSAHDQASNVARVKFHLNCLIDKPICIKTDETMANVLKRKEEKGWGFHTFPVIDAEGKFVGLITEHHFDHCRNLKSRVSDLMDKKEKVIICSSAMTVEEAYNFMDDQDPKLDVLPMIDQDGKIVGLYTYSDVKRIKTGGLERSNLDDRGRLRVAAAIGTGEQALARAELLIAKQVDALVIDAAQGDCVDVIVTLLALKNQWPDIDVIAGNVTTKASTKSLIKAGADGIKIGLGPGSTCTTRIISGVGRGQITAIYDCAQFAHEQCVPVCADGGIKYSGDITKAIAAGADTVMIGLLLAGTDEAPGETVWIDGRPFKKFRGMGSLGALQGKHRAQNRYRQQADGHLIPQGIEGVIPYQKSVGDVLAYLVGGLRQGMGFAGVANIEELQQNSYFERNTVGTSRESHPGIMMLSEAPNYHPDRDIIQ